MTVTDTDSTLTKDTASPGITGHIEHCFTFSCDSAILFCGEMFMVEVHPPLLTLGGLGPMPVFHWVMYRPFLLINPVYNNNWHFASS